MNLAKLDKKPFHLIAVIATTIVMWASVLWMIESRASVLREGQDVTLKTRPIDPRDLLRGRYVRLNYDISSVEMPNFAEVFPDETIWKQIGKTMYVTLVLGEDGRHIVGSVVVDKPENGLFLRGRVATGVGFRGADGSGSFRLNYGIERFYASETVAPDLEKRMRDGEITDIVVAVGGDGKAQIKALKQGERIFFTEQLY